MRANDDFRALALRGLDGWRAVDNAHDHDLRLLLGYGGRTGGLLLSDHQARGFAGRRLLELVAGSDFFTASATPLLFASFLTATGYINSQRPHFDLTTFSRNVDRLIRDAGLEGIVAVEFQALTNWPRRGHGRTILMNAHALLRSADAGFETEASAEQMRSSPRLLSSWGAPTVTLESLADPADLLRCLAYIIKPPLLGKRLAWKPNARPPGPRMIAVSLRPDVALRLTEVMSHVSFTEAVRGVGPDAAALVVQWRADLRAWITSRQRDLIHCLDADIDVSALWRAARELNGRPELQPVRRLDRGAEPYTPSPPTPLTHRSDGRPLLPAAASRTTLRDRLRLPSPLDDLHQQLPSM